MSRHRISLIDLEVVDAAYRHNTLLGNMLSAFVGRLMTMSTWSNADPASDLARAGVAFGTHLFGGTRTHIERC